MKELLEICAALETLGGEPCALATVIHVEGSAYRQPGARMLIAPDGRSWGMISGGCLEHDVLNHARRTMKSGAGKVVRYDSTSDDDILFGTGLGCHGIIDVLIEPVTERLREFLINAVRSCRQTRQKGAMATVIACGRRPALQGQHAFLDRDDWSGDETLVQLMRNEFLENKEAAVIEMNTFNETAQVFIQPLLPPVQLVIFGGWLDVVPLISMARGIGFQTVVVDSCRRETSLPFFHQADSVLLCSPAAALEQIQFDGRTVAVLMNHHFERDQEALAALAQISLPYVGMLGPKRRRQKILDALKAEGVSVAEDFVGRLRGPVGLDVGAKTPEEIALSIVAEILAVLNERNAKPIRDRMAPLHESPSALAYA